MITLHDKTFVPFLNEEDIRLAIEKMAKSIAADMQGKTPIFIGVLNGAFMVTSDLVKKYPGNCEVSFIRLASYEGTSSTGEISKIIGLNESMEGRDIIVVEDIVDTGNTLEELYKMFSGMNVNSLKFATLFFKPDAYKKPLKIDYIGMEIPNKFIVGYGLDYDGLGRNLPEVYQLKS